MKETNPMFTKSGIWLWILCAPLALVIAAVYESNKSYSAKEAKRRKKEFEFRKKNPEFYCWWDDQGL
ncbi:MAG: hypothetical protein J1F03_00150 [Oscillospiraceae bacterium]|nr:hypothetical protein [Oscillospiraceae bacterium]